MVSVGNCDVVLMKRDKTEKAGSVGVEKYSKMKGGGGVRVLGFFFLFFSFSVLAEGLLFICKVKLETDLSKNLFSFYDTEEKR